MEKFNPKENAGMVLVTAIPGPVPKTMVDSIRKAYARSKLPKNDARWVFLEGFEHWMLTSPRFQELMAMQIGELAECLDDYSTVAVGDEPGEVKELLLSGKADIGDWAHAFYARYESTTAPYSDEQPSSPKIDRILNYLYYNIDINGLDPEFNRIVGEDLAKLAAVYLNDGAGLHEMRLTINRAFTRTA